MQFLLRGFVVRESKRTGRGTLSCCTARNTESSKDESRLVLHPAVRKVCGWGLGSDRRGGGSVGGEGEAAWKDVDVSS